ncbi:MAG: DUF2017 family protein [bacterium]|nr:DUF2017 family protein [bacterium]MCY4273320.1 DUF2017 family protein [bacterium]
MAPRQPIRPNGDGTFRLELAAQERAVLAAIVADLEGLLADDPGDEILIRLFPTARPDDPEAEAEFREMVRDELVAKRRSRLAAVTELVEATVLDREQLAAWMGAVNDIRLVLGTRLDVSEDDEFDDAEGADPESAARAAYWYLGWLLEHLVEASATEL